MTKELKTALTQGGIVAGVMILILVIGCLLIPGRSDEQETTATTIPTPSIPANPYAPDDFDYHNGFLTCSAGIAVTGIDVSHHQQAIDWVQVKQAGIEFAIIRIGYRGYNDGLLHEDTYAAENLRQAKAAGLKIGAYFFSQAIDPQEAKEEADYALSLLTGIELDLPLAYDWEYISETARTAGMTRRMLTDCTVSFCETVKRAGLEPMIYFNRSQSRDLLMLSELTDYRWWLALYDPAMDYPYKVDMWQYTSAGSVPGISGNVDVNLMFIYDENP